MLSFTETFDVVCAFQVDERKEMGDFFLILTISLTLVQIEAQPI